MSVTNTSHQFNQSFKLKYIFLLTASIFIFGCKTAAVTTVKEEKVIIQKEIPLREYSVQSVLWQQLSGEYKALSYQAFNLAKMQLDEILASNNLPEKPLAIITDIDETVLDNSPYNAKMIEDDREYESVSWKAWGELEQATAVPGALEFFNYAQSKGVQIYYISNRKANQQTETMNNLIKLGFPYIDDAHFLLKTKESGKEARRQIVAANNNIIMLLGDNLSDFSDLFDDKSTEERNKVTDDLQADFGKKFIVLPNPMYGDWEMKGLYEGSYNWTPAQKDSLRKAKLISY
ncbi:MAG: 5'-nucleotidase, lipoprotein e(P4) family [Chitinophagales bacterium]